MGSLRKFIAEGTSIRATVVECTEVVDQLCVNSRANPLATVVLGRTVAGALLLAAQSKKEHKISVHFQGDGSLGDVYADAWFEGGCRGYVSNPQGEPTVIDGKLAVGAGIGKGFLNVTTYARGQAQPHVSSIEIQTGEVGDDLAYYLHQSQQVLSIVDVGAQVNDMGRVEIAGGLIVEMMQDVPELTLRDIEHRTRSARQVTERLQEGADALEIVGDYLDFLPLREINHDIRVKIQCTCSQSRIMNTLELLGPEEVSAMLAKDHDQEVRCQFCGACYVIPTAELGKLLARMK